MSLPDPSREAFRGLLPAPLWNAPMQSTVCESALALTALAVALLLAASPTLAAVNSGSTGAQGALNPEASIEIPLPEDGVLHYTTVNIPKGVTVTFKRNKLNTPVYLLATGNVDIAGYVDVRGGDAKPTGTYFDGLLSDDSLPGLGGPGGFDGGRGGRDDVSLRPDVVNGSPGQGPGGGAPGTTAGADCTAGSIRTYRPFYGGGAGYSVPAYRYYSQSCGAVDTTGLQFVGKAYGSTLLQPLIGGSGGGGGRGGTKYGGSGGGGGGGAILIAANGTVNIVSGGGIDVTGGSAGGVGGDGAGAWGGGGSGGAIRLVASKVIVAGSLWANGGCLDFKGVRRYCGVGTSWDGSTYGEDSPNLGGAPGRVRLEADEFALSGNIYPTYTKDAPGPVFLSSPPSLRIASVGGTDVPVDPPVGGPDVSFAEVSASPVTVIFKTVNVPPGNIVNLRLTPEAGDSVEVISGAITGSLAEGTTSISIKLPPGTSALMASTKYTVSTPVAAAPALYRYANNEKVEQIELTVATEGEPKAQLITASGKRIDISYAQLLAAGFKG